MSTTRQVPLEQYSRAILNILEDFAAEHDRSRQTQAAIINILEDFASEKTSLQFMQRAMLNILEDFDTEKSKIETINAEMRREIAERKQAEQALMEKSLALSQSNAELEQFAYVASHDLQEPLRMITSYMQIIAEDYKGKLDADADEYIGYAVEGANRMHQLIMDLLAYSRVGTGSQERAATDCNVLLDEVKANLEVALRESAALITSDPLPTVMADSSKIRQVFQNLIANAIVFRRPEPLRIHVSAKRDESFWLFSVADNGIGIEREHFERIFVIFQRLHDRTTYPGTGMGLAICKKVVDRLGGRIWVESEPGKGSTFFFRIPAQ